MPTPRNPELQQFLETCITKGLTAKEAYKKYKEQDIPKKIGTNPVSLGRFMNIYYKARIDLVDITYKERLIESIKVTEFKILGIPVFSTYTRNRK